MEVWFTKASSDAVATALIECTFSIRVPTLFLVREAKRSSNEFYSPDPMESLADYGCASFLESIAFVFLDGVSAFTNVHSLDADRLFRHGPDCVDPHSCSVANWVHGCCTRLVVRPEASLIL